MKRIFSITILSLFSAALTLSLAYANLDSRNLKEIKIVKGELETIAVYSLTRVSTTDPSIIDVANADENEVLIIGKGVGQATLFIWDEFGKHSIPVYVYKQDLAQTQLRLEKLLLAGGYTNVVMEINQKEGRIILMGGVPEDRGEQFSKLVEPFSEDIINLVTPTKGDDLVQIDMQVTELNTTLSKALGIDWSTATGGRENGIVLDYDETLPDNDGSFEDFFKIGDFGRTSALKSTINALVEEGKAHIISKPKLVVVSGEEANLLVGGEVPIRTTTTTNDSTQENVTFKEYGIDMDITPTIKGEKIDVLMKVQIRELDRANAVGEIPAFTLRTASTQLLLDDDQTVILAGLIKRNEAETERRVPFLGKIPVVGLLFRTKFTPTANQDQELVISLTPHRMPQNWMPKSVRNKIKDAASVNSEVQPNDTIVEKNSVGDTKIEDMKGNVPAVSSTQKSGDDSIKSAEKMEGQPGAENLVMEPDTTSTENQEKIQEEIALTIKNAGEESNNEEKSAYQAQEEAIKAYIQSIQQRIAQSIIYPPEAEEFGWQGTVKVGLLILNDGSLALASIKESSGYEIFDDYALEAAKRMAPFVGFPSDTNLREINITVPIVYSLKNN